MDSEFPVMSQGIHGHDESVGASIDRAVIGNDDGALLFVYGTDVVSKC